MASDWSHHDIKSNGRGGGGDVVHIDYTAYQYTDGKTTWAYEPALEAFLGHRRNMKPWLVSQRERAPLQDYCAKCDVPFADMFHPSRKQCQAKVSAPAATAYTRNSQTMDTRLFMLQHLVWAGMAWKQVQKHKATTILEVLLSKCHRYDEFGMEAFQDAWVVGANLCDNFKEGGCAHMGIELPVSEEEEPYNLRRLVLCLARFVPLGLSCAGCRHVVHVALERIAASIDDGLAESVPSIAPHKVNRKRGADGRLKRIDDTFSSFALTKIAKQSRGGNGKQLCKVDGCNGSTYKQWVLKELASYLIATNRAVEAPATVVIAEDAARLGSPAKETVIMVGWESNSGHGFVLPPQVPLGFVRWSLSGGCVAHKHTFGVCSAYPQYK